MGSAVSRAQRVTPALVSEQDALERLFSPMRSPITDQTTAKQDLHNKHRDSDISADEENLDEEVEMILEDYKNTDNKLNQNFFQKVFFMSQTCGLCYSKPGHNESDTSSANNTRLEHTKALNTDHQQFSHKQLSAGRAEPVCTKAALVPGLCDHSSLALPVFYDASEEDLMNTIEREFG